MRPHHDVPCAGLGALGFIVGALIATPVFAHRTPAIDPVDQQQLLANTTTVYTLAAGDGHALTQVITVGRSGTLIGVALSIGCSAGAVLSLDIQAVDGGLPNGTTLSTLSSPVPAGFPTTPGPFWTFWLFPGVSFTSGQQFAVNLAMAGGICSVASSAVHDPYAAGHAYWFSGTTWEPLALDDLPFQTLVEARVASTGAMGAASLVDGDSHYYLNTDARSLDVYTPAGGYSAGPVTGRLVPQAGGGEAVIFDFTTFVLGPGVLLDVVGSLGRPAVIAATGDVTIGGTLRAGHGRAGGASASAPGAPADAGGGEGGGGPGYFVSVWSDGFQTYEPLLGGGGGGGGGSLDGIEGSPSNLLIDVDGLPHALPGGAGGASSILRDVLSAGGGGGAGGNRPVFSEPITYGFGAGGRGGGALAIVTPGSLRVLSTGRIDANGEPGTASNGGGGGGGGGGGHLLLLAGGAFSVEAGGVVTAAGGNGGAGPLAPQTDGQGGDGGGGRILYVASSVDVPGSLTAGGGWVESFMEVSGVVTDLEGKGVANVPVRLTGYSVGVALTDARGRYTLSGVIPGSQTITPDLAGFTFSPAFATPTYLDMSADFVVTSGVFRRYLAEGATHSGFDVQLGVLNTTDVIAQALFNFLTPSGPISRTLAVPARTHVTFRPKIEVPGLASADFSTVLESDVPLSLDRTMSWDARGYGAHAESSVAGPASTWYLAEGATHSGFALYYLVQNPNNDAVTVDIEWLLPPSFLPPSGFQPVHHVYVPARSRGTVHVNLVYGLSNTDVSAIVRAPAYRPVIVERAMYQSRTRWFESGHDSVGVTSPQPSWFFAEGATHSGFALYLLVANPNDTEADVEIRHLLRNGVTFTIGSAQDPRLRLPPKSRLTIPVETHDARLVNVDVSAVVRETTGKGIVAERAMWWWGSYWAWTEAHNSAGAVETGIAWALASGYLGGPGQAATYVLVANTSPFPALVRATLYFENGQTATTEMTLAANSRANFNLAPQHIADYPTLVPYFSATEVAAGKRFGVRVESLDTAHGPAQIVVERAMYWSAEGVWWAAGTGLVAVRLY